MATDHKHVMVTLTCDKHEDIEDITVEVEHARRILRHPKNDWAPKTKADASRIDGNSGQTEGAAEKK